jgi:hypothetical protein
MTEKPLRPSLVVRRDEAVRGLKDRIAYGRRILNMQPRNLNALQEAQDEHQKWTSFNAEYLSRIIDSDSLKDEYLLSIPGRVISADFERKLQAFERGMKREISLLEGYIERLEIIPEAVTQASSAAQDAMAQIASLCERFHIVARTLLTRYNDRSTISIADEYDVQDLIHALLRLYCEDIRPEEWTPSYAGKSSRMDFLLKRERIVVEVKKTRVGLDAKELGDQLILDIARYSKHQDCDTLVCFVYDPDGRIKNPRGVERDLEGTQGKLNVRVLIRP